MPQKIRYGSLGYDVQVVQGILGIYADGIFKTVTYRAVRKFQKSKRLKIDGIVGEKTWSALFKHADATRQQYADDRKFGLIRYNVWLIPQMKDKACWYAAALMVRYWKREFQQMTVINEPDPSQIPAAVRLQKQNTGLAFSETVLFAKLMGLHATPRGQISMSPMFIHDLLKKHGPLWVPLKWENGGGHAVVITGISKDGAKIYFNVPWPVGRGKRDISNMLLLNKYIQTDISVPILWSYGK